MSDPAAIETRIRTAEAAADPPIRPGCEARVVWAGEKAQTDLAIVYLHGFSASPEEIRPVPDKVAAALGANLHFARLTGHGQDGAALARATLDDWRGDVAKALKVGRSLGRRVMVMGCSTGATLATIAAAEGADIAGAVHVSPNYGMASRAVGWLLDAPGARAWGPALFGRERTFALINDAHGQFWTARYPTAAVFPMAQAVAAARRANLGRVTAPALFVYSEADRVVSPAAIRATRRRWGGTTAEHLVTPGAGDDPNGHVIAGDIFSPAQTEGVVSAILDWAGRTL